MYGKLTYLSIFIIIVSALMCTKVVEKIDYDNEYDPDGTAYVSHDDVTAPVFFGVTTATAVSNKQIDLAWTAASDDITATADIVYDIYYAETSASQDFTIANITSVAGAITASITGLMPGNEYFVVVRARDQAGNRDSNNVERSVTMLFTESGSSRYNQAYYNRSYY